MSSNVDMTLVNQLEDKSYKIRKDLLNFVYHIGMGHLGGSSPSWRWQWRCTTST